MIKQPNGDDQFKLWGMINSMMVEWIFNTIGKKLRGSVSCTDTTYQLWEGLQERFSIGNEPRIYELHAEVASLNQGSMSVQDYFGKLKLIWVDLVEYEPLSACCCGNSHCKVNKEQCEKQESVQCNEFLFSLDRNRFGVTRSNILYMQPPPPLNTAFYCSFGGTSSKGECDFCSMT